MVFMVIISKLHHILWTCADLHYDNYGRHVEIASSPGQGQWSIDRLSPTCQSKWPAWSSENSTLATLSLVWLAANTDWQTINRGNLLRKKSVSPTVQAAGWGDRRID